MLCPTCSSPNEDDSTFCQSCGARLSQGQATVAPAEPGTLTRLQRDAIPYVAFSNFEVGLQTDPWLDVQWDKHKNPNAEPLDHDIPKRVLLIDLCLEAKDEHEPAYRKILDTRAQSALFITDSRVIQSCKTWDESSFSVVALAKHYKIFGHVYGGHIRYEWLNEVRFWDKRGLLAANEVQLGYKDAAGNDYRARTIIQGRNPHSTDIATEIIAKACRYRLAMTDNKTDEQIDFFTTSAQTPKFEHDLEQEWWWSIKIPGAYPASAGKEFRPR